MGDGQFNGPLVGDGLGPGLPPDEGQGPVVAVVGDAQQDLGRRDGGDRIVQHLPDVGQGCHRHGRARGVAPLVGHQQNAVHRLAHGGVVVALVQQACLPGGGFGGQGRPQEKALGMEQPPQPGQEFCISGGQGAGQILKVHIQPGVTPAAEGLQDLRDQLGLDRLVRQHQSAPLRVELAVLCQGGQVHHRPDAPLSGGGEQSVVRQGQQAAGGGDAVGEGSQIAEIGQLRGQEGRVNGGIGIAAEEGRSKRLAEVGDHQGLPGPQVRAAAQGPVVLPQPPDRGAVGCCQGEESLPWTDHMDGLGKANHQGLSHRQGAVGAYVVVGRQTAGVHAVLRGNGGHGVAGPDHMDVHLHITPFLQAYAVPAADMRRTDRGDAGRAGKKTQAAEFFLAFCRPILYHKCR